MSDPERIGIGVVVALDDAEIRQEQEGRSAGTRGRIEPRCLVELGKGSARHPREMMNEISNLKNHLRPDETLFVVDSMTGQDAVNTAKESQRPP